VPRLRQNVDHLGHRLGSGLYIGGGEGQFRINAFSNRTSEILEFEHHLLAVLPFVPSSLGYHSEYLLRCHMPHS
jgi:hypothetical protein